MEFSEYVEMKVSQAYNYSEYLLTMPSNNLQTTRLKTQFILRLALSSIAIQTSHPQRRETGVMIFLFREHYLLNVSCVGCYENSSSEK